MTSLEIKMTTLMDRMTRMEADIVNKDDMETKDQRITVFEAALNDKDAQMSELEKELKSLTGRTTVTEDIFAFQCAWKDRWEAGSYHHLRQTDL